MQRWPSVPHTWWGCGGACNAWREGQSAARVLWGGGASSGQSSLERVERVRGLRSAPPNCRSCRSPRAGSATGTCVRRKRGLTYQPRRARDHSGPHVTLWRGMWRGCMRRGMCARHVRVACGAACGAACACARAGRVRGGPPSPLLRLSEKELERLFRDESFPAPGLCASSASLLRVDESAQLVLDSRTPSTTGSGGAPDDGLKKPKMPRFAGFAPAASR